MIKRLYIHNFRCLENFDLPIAGKPSVLLIGKNGVGKSTIGAALETLQQIARGVNRVSQLVQPSDLAHGRVEIPVRFEMEAEIRQRTYAYSLALELPEGFRELRVLEERLTVDGEPIYSRDVAQVKLHPKGKSQSADFLVDWHLVALPLIQERSDTDPLHLFKTWLARMLLLAPIPSLISGNSASATFFLRRDVANLGDWYTAISLEFPAVYASINQYLKEIMPDFYDIQNPLVGKEARSMTVQFRQEQASLRLAFEALSDGEKCFFLCAVVLAANQAYGPLFCFWDEPDNYLSLAEVGHFVMALRRSFEGGGQLLVTSHNPETVRKFSDENTLVMDRRSRLEPPIVRPLTDLAIQGDLIEALIRGDIER